MYGVRKLWRAQRREGTAVGRDQVGRIMRALGLAGATRTKRMRTTQPATVSQRPADLVERVFSAPAPNRVWVADPTCVWTSRGFVYTAFIVDAFSRAIVGWRVSVSLQAAHRERTGIVIDRPPGRDSRSQRRRVTTARRRASKMQPMPSSDMLFAT